MSMSMAFCFFTVKQVKRFVELGPSATSHSDASVCQGGMTASNS